MTTASPWCRAAQAVWSASPSDSLLCIAGEAEAPRVLGDTVRFSMPQDPDGNFIELSERASLVGRRSQAPESVSTGRAIGGVIRPSARQRPGVTSSIGGR